MRTPYLELLRSGKHAGQMPASHLFGRSLLAVRWIVHNFRVK